MFVRRHSCHGSALNLHSPGTTKIERLDENLGALKIQLSNEEEQAIRKACEEAEIHGDRYPQAMAAALFADTPAMS